MNPSTRLVSWDTLFRAASAVLTPRLSVCASARLQLCAHAPKLQTGFCQGSRPTIKAVRLRTCQLASMDPK